MLSFRGDAHRFYLQLKNASIQNQSLEYMEKLKEVEEIQKFYDTLDSSTLRFVYYRMLKEKNGSGIIPIYITSIPWFLFLFSTQLQKLLFKEGSILWFVFGIVYLLTLSICIILHFREKAWTNFHIEIIQDILKTRKNNEHVKGEILE